MASAVEVALLLHPQLLLLSAAAIIQAGVIAVMLLVETPAFGRRGVAISLKNVECEGMFLRPIPHASWDYLGNLDVLMKEQV